MLTQRCQDCQQVKQVELFDLHLKRRTGRSAECKECRRRRQNRAGYSTCRNLALQELARRHPEEYQRRREQARLELAPDTAGVEVWHQARGPALAELAGRHQAEWHQRYRRLRVAQPDWPSSRAFMVATNQVRIAHRQEYLELLRGYAGARRAGPKLVYKIMCRAQRLLQLAHPQEYQALYAAERARIGNPVHRSLHVPGNGLRPPSPTTEEARDATSAR